MERSCTKCSSVFSVTEGDVAFYERMGVLTPVECPLCREQKRECWRNEKTLYLRDCGLCGDRVVSIFSPDKPYKVYCKGCWWSDGWDQNASGRDFDFGRPFFEQFDELMRDAVLISLFGERNENSEYVNQETDNKNCYMNTGGHYNEDCYHNTYSIWGKDNVDNYWVIRSELLYECVKCEKCFDSSFLYECESCANCHYSRDLKSCKNCFGCVGLRHKEYYFFNEKFSKAEYEARVRDFLDTPEGREKALINTREHFLKYPCRASKLINCQNSTGDDLLNCKNMVEGYLAEEMEDCKYAYIGLQVKDGHDMTSFGWGEMVFNVASSIHHNNVICSTQSLHVNFCAYCYMCFNSSNLFGCVGLSRKEYCILNKQYNKEEYFEMRERIVEHMKQTGEWGQFFPYSICPFGYNETMAQDYFPISEEEAGDIGAKWQEKDKKEYRAQTYSGSYKIADVPESVTKEILACSDCGRNYKIILPELKHYKRCGIHLPDKCPPCRHKRRLSLLNPKKLWQRQCGSCGGVVETTFSPERGEVVYCEECYLKEFY